jgi:hypothetical protein
MSRVTAARVAVGLICLALATVAVLLARDVWQVRSALRNGDVRARVASVGGDTWSADTTLPVGIARELLGVSDDLEFRALLVHARAMTGRPANDDEVRQRLPVKTALVRAEHSADRVRASEAANLLGVIYSTDPNEPDRTAAEKALDEFVTAVQLDPDNELAKANLELFLRQQENSIRGRRGASSGELPGHAGAGLRAGGRGY